MNKFLLQTYIQGNEDTEIQTKEGGIPSKRLITLYSILTHLQKFTKTDLQTIINSIDLKKGFDPSDAGKILDALDDLRKN